MKKQYFLLLVTIIAVSANFSQAQTYMIEKFNLSAMGKDYGIYTNISYNSWDDLYFDMDAPNDQQFVQAQLSFSPKKYEPSELESFIKSLLQAKEFYLKWSNIARTIDLKLFSKRIPVNLVDKDLYFTDNGKWYNESGVDMKYTFFVDHSGYCYMIIESDYMTSTETLSESYSFSSAYNSYLQKLSLGFSKSQVTIERYCGGASLTFSNSTEIDEFINKLRKIPQFKENNQKKGDMLN